MDGTETPEAATASVDVEEKLRKAFGASWFVSFVNTQAAAGFPERLNVSKHEPVSLAQFERLQRWKRLTPQTTACAASVLNPDVFRGWLVTDGPTGLDVELAV